MTPNNLIYLPWLVIWNFSPCVRHSFYKSYGRGTILWCTWSTVWRKCALSLPMESLRVIFRRKVGDVICARHMHIFHTFFIAWPFLHTLHIFCWYISLIMSVSASHKKLWALTKNVLILICISSQKIMPLHKKSMEWSEWQEWHVLNSEFLWT